MIGVTGFLTFSRESTAVGKSSALAVVICGLASTWAVALLAISLAIAGDAGIGYALAFIVSGAAAVFINRPIVSLVAGLMIPLALLIAFPGSHGHPSWIHDFQECRNRLRSIGSAIDRYVEVHGHYPPAYVADEHGTPMHSWRVLILPYLDRLASDVRGGANDTYADVYSEYREHEPWNSPHNATLAERVTAYQCVAHRRKGSASPHATSYLAVVGEQAFWPGATPRQLGDIPDGMTRTACVIEATPIDNWMAPEDLSIDEAVAYLTGELSEHRIPSRTVLWDASVPCPRFLLIADGHVELAAVAQPADVSAAVLDVADGKPTRGGDALFADPFRAGRAGAERLAIVWCCLVVIPAFVPLVRRFIRGRRVN
ncbi:MAG: DUF1559 domain-containing protein [Planctomycetaceae bacterium]